MKNARRHAGTFVTLTAAALAISAPAGAIVLPAGFEAIALPGTLDVPVGFTIDPAGRFFIVEQAGRVRVHNGVALQTQPFIDLSAEVNGNSERGLLGIALHPGFLPDDGPTSWVYLQYTVSPVRGEDYAYNQDNRYSFSRLTRYRARSTPGGLIIANSASRQVLLGRKLANGVVPDGIASCHSSHASGSLEFADDGSLFVANGDGAHWDFQDNGGADPACFATFVHPQTGQRGPMPPFEDSGAFRSLDPRSLAGKILRIDPETGLGYPSNPFFNGDPAANRSKIWVTGLRNPFRIALKPGTGAADPALGQPNTIYIGDVGWNNWEETNVAYGGERFGWPCFEGTGPHVGYQSFERGADPLQRPDCDNMPPALHVAPLFTWNHSDPMALMPPGFHVDEQGSPLGGFVGSSSTGGAFYQGGGTYPASYAGRYFFADYSRRWIRTMETDGNDQLVAVRDFATDAGGPVDFQRHPLNGDVYYLALFTFEVFRIIYTGP